MGVGRTCAGRPGDSALARGAPSRGVAVEREEEGIRLFSERCHIGARRGDEVLRTVGKGMGNAPLP